jgi:hypothetical protein
MTIEAIIGMSVVSTVRKVGRTSAHKVGKFSEFSLEEVDEPSADGISSAHTLTSVNTVLSLGLFNTQNTLQEHSHEHGKELLHYLQLLHTEILYGDPEKQKAALHKLRGLIMQKREISSNYALEEALEAIELRTLIELAKRENVSCRNS